MVRMGDRTNADRTNTPDRNRTRWPSARPIIGFFSGFPGRVAEVQTRGRLSARPGFLLHSPSARTPSAHFFDFFDRGGGPSESEVDPMSPSLVCVLALLVGGDPKPVENVAVTIRARVPASTPRDAKVYLAGNLAVVGEWKPAGRELMRLEDGRFAATILIPRGETLEYKLTLGSWKRVEKEAEGKDRANRVLAIDRSDPIEVEVEVVAWSSGEPGKSTITGTVKPHPEFASKVLGNARTVLVWLPPGYDAEPGKRYPVVYFQDGQNILDNATSFAGEWRADETADRLIRDGKLPPIILVAVASNRDRINEFTHVKDEKHNDGGKGPLYARFLVEELKPFIDKTYRTKPGRESTAVIGSSLGGLVAMEIALDHPEAFGLCAALSPSIWWANDRLIADAKSHAEAARRVRFWIDMGTREGAKKGEAVSPAVDRAKALAKALEADGLTPERDFHLEIIEDGEHNEAAWAARLDRVLIYLFHR